MRIAYLNTDEVNQAVAASMARRYGGVVYGLHPKDPPPDGRYDAVMYNLDEMPRHGQDEVIAEILRGPSNCPKAVHGYGLSEQQAVLLRLHGVAVAHRLGIELVRILCQAVRDGQASVPPDDALVEETWISVVK
jgi:hypothetical protein